MQFISSGAKSLLKIDHGFDDSLFFDTCRRLLHHLAHRQGRQGGGIHRTPDQQEKADAHFKDSKITYLFGIGDGTTVINGHGMAMYINHSCDPNCETEELRGRVWVMSTAHHRAGEELTYDYNLYDGDEDDARCYCGASNCRKTMYSPEEIARRKKAAKRKALKAAEQEGGEQAGVSAAQIASRPPCPPVMPFAISCCDRHSGYNQSSEAVPTARPQSEFLPMAYQVLARKYRPQRFSDVAGQEHVTRTLGHALEQQRVAHGYIFSGHRGIGKTTIARILAMALNCRNKIGSAERPSPEPCGVCDSCKEIRAGNSLDVIEIDAATNRGIDEIRELRDAARYAPARDRYKIYLLDEAHQITDAAFNALLKTLEEPPEHVVFMMATTQPEDIPQTIRSRCQHFSFHAVKFDDIVTQLTQIAAQEDILADPQALALLAEAGDGSMRDALSIMDQAIASAPMVDGKAKLDGNEIRELMGTVPDAVFERILEAIGEGQSAAVMEELNRLLNAGNSPSQMARQLVRYLRNCLMAKLGGENTELLQISGDERARAVRSAALFSEEDLTRFLQVMLRTFDELNYRQEPRLHLELGLMKLVHLQRLLPLEQILSGLPAAGASAQRPSRGPRSDAGAGAAAPAPPQSARSRPSRSQSRLPRSSWTASGSRAQTTQRQ